MKPVQDSIELTVASAGSKVTAAGTAVTTVGWLSSSNFGMWAGIAIGVIGLLVNIVFKVRADLRARAADRRAIEAHQAYLRTVGTNFPPIEVQEQDE